MFVSGSVGTVAYNAVTGARLWLAATGVLAGSGGSTPAPTAAVSPNGAKVFVAGSAGSPSDFTTFAYDAATGKQLWAKRYDGPATGADDAHAVAVNPDGTTVYVTGMSERSFGWDVATVAYNTSTGAQRWVARYAGTGTNKDDRFAAALPTPQSLAVSHDGATVFVTGTSRGAHTLEYATIAYSAKTGARLWTGRYHNPEAFVGDEVAFAVAVSPRDDIVFTTGGSYSDKTGLDIATVAYSAATGAQRWVSRYDGPANRNDSGGRIVVAPSGDTLVVTGVSESAPDAVDYATLGYDASTGTQLWVQRHKATVGLVAGLGLSPDGTKVYVAGATSHGLDYATVAYSTTSGRQLWITGYVSGEPKALAVSRNGTVFVTAATNNGYTTIAYHG